MKLSEGGIPYTPPPEEKKKVSTKAVEPAVTKNEVKHLLDKLSNMEKRVELLELAIKKFVTQFNGGC